MTEPPEDPVEREILRELSERARGWDAYGRRISNEEQARAVDQFTAIKGRQEQRRLEREHLNADLQRVAYETEKAQAEAEKLRVEAEIERERIELEGQRLQVERANVVVRALEAVASGKMPMEKLLPFVQELGSRLLGGDRLPLAIEDKSKEEDKK